MRERVCVTGIGMITPIKPFQGMDEFWNALCSGEDAIKKIKPPMFNHDKEIGRAHV